jgi:hypothetical protein
MGSTSSAGSVVVPNKGWVIYGIYNEDHEVDVLASIILNFFLQLMLWQYYSCMYVNNYLL